MAKRDLFPLPLLPPFLFRVFDGSGRIIGTDMCLVNEPVLGIFTFLLNVCLQTGEHFDR
jgi:hypothetical protein